MKRRRSAWLLRTSSTCCPAPSSTFTTTISRDRTAERARDAGALVRSEPLQGKGNVVRRMFADVEADIYVLVDGDDTYDAAATPEMVRRLVEDRLDMVNGARVTPVG